MFFEKGAEKCFYKLLRLKYDYLCISFFSQKTDDFGLSFNFISMFKKNVKSILTWLDWLAKPMARLKNKILLEVVKTVLLVLLHILLLNTNFFLSVF